MGAVDKGIGTSSSTDTGVRKRRASSKRQRERSAASRGSGARPRKRRRKVPTVERTESLRDMDRPFQILPCRERADNANGHLLADCATTTRGGRP
jgi:hypothetical protein